MPPRHRARGRPGRPGNSRNDNTPPAWSSRQPRAAATSSAVRHGPPSRRCRTGVAAGSSEAAESRPAHNRSETLPARCAGRAGHQRPGRRRKASCRPATSGTPGSHRSPLRRGASERSLMGSAYPSAACRWSEPSEDWPCRQRRAPWPAGRTSGSRAGRYATYRQRRSHSRPRRKR